MKIVAALIAVSTLIGTQAFADNKNTKNSASNTHDAATYGNTHNNYQAGASSYGPSHNNYNGKLQYGQGSSYSNHQYDYLTSKQAISSSVPY